MTIALIGASALAWLASVCAIKIEQPEFSGTLSALSVAFGVFAAVSLWF
jgi:hypothetical protein